MTDPLSISTLRDHQHGTNCAKNARSTVLAASTAYVDVSGHLLCLLMDSWELVLKDCECDVSS